jgi:AcrR family transcriptional regulator
MADQEGVDVVSASAPWSDDMTRVVVPRGPYQKGIRRRREIVDAASRIFARYGYGGGSLRQIADDVGVTPAALARHFENKYGLLQAVLVHWEEDVDHRFDGAHGLEYFRGLPGAMEDQTSEPGLIELLLTLCSGCSIRRSRWCRCSRPSSI